MDFSYHGRTSSAEATQKLGESFGAFLIGVPSENQAKIVTLEGELGAGKTTFLQGFGSLLGVQGRLTSPTYLIHRQYALNENRSFSHIDLYRIQNAHEIDALGLNELFVNPNTIVAIEWPEKLKTPITLPHYQVQFKSIDGDTREIVIGIYK